MADSDARDERYWTEERGQDTTVYLPGCGNRLPSVLQVVANPLQDFFRRLRALPGLLTDHGVLARDEQRRIRGDPNVRALIAQRLQQSWSVVIHGMLGRVDQDLLAGTPQIIPSTPHHEHSAHDTSTPSLDPCEWLEFYI